MEGSTIILTDDTGKTLPCIVETTFEIDSTTYLLIMPDGYAVQIYAWQPTEDSDGNEEEEEETELEDVTEEEIEAIFPIAQAVLAEQNLTLKRTAYTLTVEGDLPEADDDDIIEIDTEEDGNCGEFQELAHFYYEEKEFSVFTSLDPIMFVAKLNEDNEPQLLMPHEIPAIEPHLEKYLSHVLDAEDTDEEV
ncbi:MAG: DUF3727 domain-containing protein [Pseudanabaena sp. ELA607]|jgi:hypothetical protein